MEKGGGEGLLVVVQLGEDLGRCERVLDERLARPALLTVVRAHRERRRPLEERSVGVGLVGEHIGDQPLDEILMSLG